MFTKFLCGSGFAVGFGVVVFLAFGAPAGAQEVDNEFVTIMPDPTLPAGSTFSGWNNFEIVVAGDQSGLGPIQNPFDLITNPFAANGPTTITSFYDPGSDTTTIEFAGNPIPPDNQNIGPVGTVHFGLTGSSDNAPLDILKKYWSGQYIDPAGDPPIGVTSSVAAVNMVPSVPPPDPGTVGDFAVVFADFAQGGVEGGAWFEVPVKIGQTPTFTFNSGFASPGDPITFSEAKFFLSPTQIPLDNLNFTDLPPTDPQFISLPLPAPIDSSTPEPASLLLMTAAALPALLKRRRRRS